MPKLIPNLWMDTQGLEAAELYCSIFPNSRVTAVTHYPAGGPREEGTVMTVSFELDGQPFTIINGGPEFTFDEAVSFEIECEDQAEVDRYWDALTADGGQPGPCGWLKDKFGLSWQVVPTGMVEVLTGPDKEAASRAMQAMMGMSKLDVAALEAAARGDRPA